MQSKWKKLSAFFVTAFVLLLAGVLCLFSSAQPIAVSAEKTVLSVNGSGTYVLFNSGNTSSVGANQSGSSCSYNVDATTLTNGGYDIYARCNAATVPGVPHSGCVQQTQVGLSFTVDSVITDRVDVSINAYDVDESDGEVDYVYLVDETDGSNYTVGTLSGMNDEWNNTSFTVAPEEFTKGHTYHYEIKVTSSCSEKSWWVYIRNVNMQVKGLSAEEVFSRVNLSAEIDANGKVTAWFYAATKTQTIPVRLEFKATHIATNNQLGSLFIDSTISPVGQQQQFDFPLNAGSPYGVYQISLYIKDTSNNILAMLDCNASYGEDVYSVTYNSNGGSYNLPTDNNTYETGDTVEVKFDYIPARIGYTFLGWSVNPNAIVAEYTQDGNRQFSMGTNDVTLYAVWEEKEADHDCEWIEGERIPPTCTQEGIQYYICIHCSAVRGEILPNLPHEYEILEQVEPSCTENGYIVYQCVNCGHTYTETLPKTGHHYICEFCGEEHICPEDSQDEEKEDPVGIGCAQGCNEGCGGISNCSSSAGKMGLYTVLIGGVGILLCLKRKNKNN